MFNNSDNGVSKIEPFTVDVISEWPLPDALHREAIRSFVLLPEFIPVPFSFHLLSFLILSIRQTDRPTDRPSERERAACCISMSRPAHSDPGADQTDCVRCYCQHVADAGRSVGRLSPSLLTPSLPPSLPPDSRSHSVVRAYLSQMQLRQHSFVQWTKWEKGGERR